MKRLSKSGRLSQIRVARSRERRRLKRQRNCIIYVEGAPKLGNRVTIPMPETVSLFEDENAEKLAEVVKRMRAAVIRNYFKVRLDFSPVSHFYVSGILKVHAEAKAAESLAGRPNLVSYRQPRDPAMKRILRHFDFLGSDDNKNAHHGIISITSGTQQLFRKELFNNLNIAFYGGELQRDHIAWKKIQGSLGEAVLNVLDHAYESDDREEMRSSLGTRWWLVAQTIRNQLFIAICDKGVGIPRTLFSSQKAPRVKQVLARYLGALKTREAGPDSAAIKAAMTYGRSRLNRQHGGRGTGLSEVRGLVEQNPMGELTIYSNRGCYVFTPSGLDWTRELSSSMHGTLIQWNISLDMEVPELKGEGSHEF